MNIPLVEFDPDPDGMVEFADPKIKFKEIDCCVISFFGEVVKKVSKMEGAERIGEFLRDVGDFPLYMIPYRGKNVAFYYSGVGAPLAICMLEKAISYGLSKFVACGGAGALEKGLQAGKIVIPISALRDEGTSYHYSKAERTIDVDPGTVEVLKKELEKDGIDYLPGRTWTTDAPYRETKEKVALRRKEGCMVVEMECAAFISACRFRDVKFGQYLYCGDDLSGEKWDHRDWTTHEIREEIFWKAMDAVTEL